MPGTILSSYINEKKNSWQTEYSFDLFGWSSTFHPLHFDFYSDWIKEQRHGEMNYLEAHMPIKKDLRFFFEQAQSLISVGIRYKPHPSPTQNNPQNLKIASYAEGLDYHDWLTKRLERFCQHLRQLFPNATFAVATDAKPLLERDFAEQLGLGWTGKNTCLIHPKVGSFFLLGEILTDLKIQEDQAFVSKIPDFCGNCTRCLDACPTGALIEPRKMDASRCISYLTIEAKSVPKLELRNKIGDLFFGCDICQDVCPWNEKVFRTELQTSKTIEPQNRIAELRYILSASNRDLELKFHDSPIIRARPRGLRRNALVVVGNLKIFELRKEVEALCQNEFLGELAQWTLAQLPEQN